MEFSDQEAELGTEEAGIDGDLMEFDDYSDRDLEIEGPHRGGRGVHGRVPVVLSG